MRIEGCAPAPPLRLTLQETAHLFGIGPADSHFAAIVHHRDQRGKSRAAQPQGAVAAYDRAVVDAQEIDRIEPSVERSEALATLAEMDQVSTHFAQ